MKTNYILNSLVFMTLLVGLTSCYTRLGYLSEEQVYEEYSEEDSDAYTDADQDQVVVHHVYLPPKYHPRYIYFDPYDAWYFEPGFGFWFGYYSGPVYLSIPVYYPPYPYPYPYPYPVYYPPYHYPYPVYYPPVWGGGYHVPGYAYTPNTLKRREFGRRTEMALTTSKTISRRGSDTVGSGSVSRRTLTKAPDSGSDGSRVSGRRTNDKRGQEYTAPETKDYSRSGERKRTETKAIQPTTDNSRQRNDSGNRRSNNSGQSTKTETGNRTAVSRKSNTSSGSSGSSSGTYSTSSNRPSTPSVSSSPSSRTSSGGSRSAISGSSSGSKSSSGSTARSSSGSSSRSGSSNSGSSSRRR
jgi:hypothetical protein